MKIGIDTQSTIGQKTGFGSYVANLVDNLQRVNHGHEYLLLQPDKQRDFTTPQRLVWDQVTLPRIARASGVDILHQPSFSSPVVFRGKTVVTVHDLVALFLGQNLSFWTRQFFAQWAPFSYRFADHVIAVSEQTKFDIVKYLHIPEQKITVIYEAVDQRFRSLNDPEAITTVRRKYQLGQEPIILHVGTLEPRKNLAFLIRAFGLAKQQKNFSGTLVIAGKRGWYYHTLFDLVEQLGLRNDVLFIGYVEDVDLPALYNAATIFTWPSQYEGFGLPPLEAMASGLPVISSNSSSMPEVIGQGGLLLPIHNEAEWAEAMLNLMNSTQDRQTLRLRGMQQAQQFSWERCARETIAVYEKVNA